MINRRSLRLILVIAPVVLALTLSFLGFTDIIIGSDDDDRVGAGEGVLNGSPNADIIKGCAGGDEINGLDGRDRLFGDGRPAACKLGDAEGDESDSIFGGDGNDYINGNDGGDYIDGEGGRDRISGDAGDDEIHGGLDNDRLDGGDGNDSLYGEEDNDVLNGSSGDDFLDGGDGNDTLDGGPGTDYLIGGGGDDVFYLRRGQAGDGTEIVECTQKSGETGRVLLLRTKDGGFPRGTPSGTFTNTTVEIPDPDGDGVFSIQAGPGECKIFRR